MDALGFDRLDVSDLFGSSILAIDPRPRPSPTPPSSASTRWTSMISGPCWSTTSRPSTSGRYGRWARANLDQADVTAMKIHGVTPDFVEEMAVLGYPIETASTRC
jgi:hypothetical protein